LAPLGSSGTAPKVLVVAGHAGRWPVWHAAQHRDRPHPPVSGDEGAPHLCALAKYTHAHLRMPRCHAPSSRVPARPAAG
jgi:hypothetical protein